MKKARLTFRGVRVFDVLEGQAVPRTEKFLRSMYFAKWAVEPMSPGRLRAEFKQGLSELAPTNCMQAGWTKKGTRTYFLLESVRSRPLNRVHRGQEVVY